MSKTEKSDRRAPVTEEAVSHDIEGEVLRRYGEGAQKVQPALCCPTKGYNPKLLEMLPEEILQTDYGCGDPTAWVGPGETVLDLGSGAGKACYMLSQKVGPEGRVIGVDFNDKMLALSRKYLDEMGEKLGYRNVSFVKGKIQDLKVDMDAAQSWLSEHPVQTVEQAGEYEAELERLARVQPLVADNSVDTVVSNCVLNLVRPRDKQRLFQELYRVLRRGGKAVISDIVCDEDPTPEILADPELWSGCIAGAFREDRFLEMFQEAGFYGVEIVARQEDPWHAIDGVEFRSLTVRAFKGKEGPCVERNQAVIYKGPWKAVEDDDGHTYYRGKRMAICDKTFSLLVDPAGPYSEAMIGIEPFEEVPIEEARPFRCTGAQRRDPRETKGSQSQDTPSPSRVSR